MSKLKTLVIATLALLSVNVVGANNAWSLTDQQISTLRLTYASAMSSMHDVLEGVSAYSVARARQDEQGMRRAAAFMLGALAESRMWMALLDLQVTPEDFGADADRAVTNLREMLATTFDDLDDAFFSNDLDAINARLDDSADRFNQLFLDVNAIAAAVGPALGRTQ